jgi:cystathionine beta-lyase
MNFDDLAQKAQDPTVKMAILCSPHNPIGRVWTAEELRRFGEICNEHNVLVVSDEVHCDLMLNGNAFINYATLGPEFAQKSVICTAGSKTFSLAGLKTSNIIIFDTDMHARFQAQLQKSKLAHSINFLGQVALQAAYEDGENWLEQILVYLTDNCNWMLDYFEKHIPEIKMIQPEGTYLAWLDCSGLRMEGKELHQFFNNKANLYLEEGNMFGDEGLAFMRLNFACPRHILKEALDRIHRAVTDWRTTAANPNP